MDLISKNGAIFRKFQNIVEPNSYNCSKCNKPFARMHDLTRHIRFHCIEYNATVKKEWTEDVKFEESVFLPVEVKSENLENCDMDTKDPLN